MGTELILVTLFGLPLDVCSTSDQATCRVGGMQVRQSSTSLQECQQIIVTVEWMRLVQSLFQDVFTLALQVCLSVLVPLFASAFVPPRDCCPPLAQQ